MPVPQELLEKYAGDYGDRHVFLILFSANFAYSIQRQLTIPQRF
jgi:hypothetical protein